MDKFTPEQPIVFANPEAEIAHLKNEVKRHIEAEKLIGKEVAPSAVASETLKNYASAKPEAVLAPENQLKTPEIEAIVLDLTPEAHDQQIEQLFGVMQTRVCGCSRCWPK